MTTPEPRPLTPREALAELLDYVKDWGEADSAEDELLDRCRAALTTTNQEIDVLRDALRDALSYSRPVHDVGCRYPAIGIGCECGAFDARDKAKALLTPQSSEVVKP